MTWYSVLGKVTALAGSVRGGGQRAFGGPDVPLTPVDRLPPPEPANVTLDTLDIIGRENEAVRNICADVVQKVGALSTLGADLDALFAQIDIILRDRDRTKSELIQRDAVLAMLEETHSQLKKAHAEILNDHERSKAELGILRPEAQRLLEKVRTQEGRIDSLEAEWTEQRNTLAATATQLESEKARAGYLADEAASLRSEVEKSDALVSQLQTESGDLRYKLSVSDETGRALQTALTDHQQNGSRLSAELESLKTAYEAERQRFAALEAEWNNQQGEHQRARLDQQQEIDQLRAAAVELQARHDQLASLHEVSDRALADTRAELQARVDELRQEERRTRETLAASTVAEKKLQTETAANAELTERVAELDKNRATLVAQIKPLLKTIQDQKAEIERLQKNIDAQNDRIGQEAGKHAAETNRLEATIKELTGRIEDEKARRALAEGALEEDRRARVELQLAVSAAKGPVAPEARRPAAVPRPELVPAVAGAKRVALL